MTEVSICNQALGWVGGDLITAFTDGTVEAKLCEANYAALRDAVLEDHAWVFATKRDTLTPLTEPPDWGFGQAFLLPPDTIRVLEVDDTTQGFGTMEWVREGRQIHADAERIFLRYTSRVVDTAQFSPAFVQALAQRIAAEFAIPLAESRELQVNHWAVYNEKISNAAATDGMQGRRERTNTSRLRGARSGFYPGSSRGGSLGNVLLDP